MLGVRSRSTLRVAPDVRAPERHPALRRAGQGSRERRTDPAGTPRGRLEPRRPAAAHAARHADRPRGARPVAAHPAAGRTRPPPVPRPLQLQPVETLPHAHVAIRVSGIPEARRDGVEWAGIDLGRLRVELAVQVAPRGGDRATGPRGRSAVSGSPREDRRLLRQLDGRREGAHDQLPERGPPDRELPREGRGAPPARDRAQQAAVLIGHRASVGRAPFGPVIFGRTISKTSCVRQYRGPPSRPIARSLCTSTSPSVRIASSTWSRAASPKNTMFSATRTARIKRHSKFTGDSAIRGARTTSEDARVRLASSNSLTVPA